MRKRPAQPIRNKSQVLDIQQYLLADGQTEQQKQRNYVLFLVGVTTGYRAGDLVILKVRDVKAALRAGEFTIMEGKKEKSKNIRERNRKARTVIIIPKLKKILKDYIQDMKEYEYIFKSRNGVNKAITVREISKQLKRAGKYFGLENITAHSMRKTYAYKIYIENDRDILLVKEMLGHSSIEETKRYLGLDRERYDEASSCLSDFIE